MHRAIKVDSVIRCVYPGMPIPRREPEIAVKLMNRNSYYRRAILPIGKFTKETIIFVK